MIKTHRPKLSNFWQAHEVGWPEHLLSLLLTISLATVFAWPVEAQPTTAPAIIPLPRKIHADPGVFALRQDTRVLAETTALPTAAYLAEQLRKSTATPFAASAATSAAPLKNAILLTTAQAKTSLGAEGYELTVTPDIVVIRAPDPAGLFYGAQSLLQMLPPETCFPQRVSVTNWTVPCLQIEDQPRFPWRGFMLDESRHFFGKAVVKQTLDAMARLKLNRFHWHLTDEPGWRIEIKKYPKLTELGAMGNWSNAKALAAFYTQADIQELVEYARRRHILIIPEIDMPGHATAATRAYPEFSGGGTNQWKGFTFNPAKEQTYRFIEEVLTEVVALFPGPYLHIGGDEVSYGNQSWKTDPQIQQFIREHNLKDPVGLEHYFVRRVNGIVHRLGKTMVGWDEIIDAEVPPQQSLVMWWRHDKPQVLSRALDKGYPVILCPRRPCYFDFVQDDSHKHGRRWNGFNDLVGVYAFPESLKQRLPANSSQVLGLQACLWTERVAETHRLGFMTFPRLAAIAEAGWTPGAEKERAGFEKRLPAFLRWLQLQGISYFDPFNPVSTPEPPGPAKKAEGTAEG